MIRVKYNLDTKQVLGNYPPNINYPSITIDEENKTITDSSGTFPYIEITKEQHEANIGKNMVVINDNYQEYIKTNAELLQEAKDAKIKELEIFHESDSARILTINEKFQVNTNYETTRKWFNEIIDDLKNEAYVTGTSYKTVTFDWEISTGVWIPLNLEQLCQFKYAVFNITKTNFKQYRAHIKAIEALSSVEDVNSYDFTQGYLLDNQLTFDL